VGIEPVPMGNSSSPSYFVRQLFGVLTNVGAFLFTRSFFFLIRYLERMLTGRLLQIVAGAAVGMHAREMYDAIIEPQKEIGVPEFFDERLRDVSTDLLDEPPVAAASSAVVLENYMFLWNKEALDKAVEASATWPEILKNSKEIVERYHGYSNFEFEKFGRRLLYTSLMLEMRIREVIGSASLMHCTYYANNKIVDEIAEFIGHSCKTPRWPKGLFEQTQRPAGAPFFSGNR
jgi:hypothetical protein